MSDLSPFVTPSSGLAGEREERILLGESMLSYGITYLDDMSGGIAKNELIVLAGRSGQGKSELALHISVTNAKKGKRVYHLALEAEKREIERRLLFKEIALEFYSKPRNRPEPLNYRRWYQAKQESMVTDEIYHAASQKLEALSSLNIFYRAADFGMKEMNMIFASIKSSCDLLVLDHLHYFDFDGDENKEQKKVMKEIRDLALQHAIPVIVVVHVRKGDKRNPTPVPDIEDIHGSSDIFKICTQAISIAPAKDIASSDPTKYPTYIQIGKSRLDGSVRTFCGIATFDITKNNYSEEYKFGKFTLGGEWEEIDDVPVWAKHAKKNNGASGGREAAGAWRKGEGKPSTMFPVR